MSTLSPRAPANANVFATRSEGRTPPANPRVSAKLQSRLIMLGPRKDAVRRPQHGYKELLYKKEGYVVAQ